jgi:hypothetical protein
MNTATTHPFKLLKGLLFLLLISASQTYAQQSPVSLLGELRKLQELSTLPAYEPRLLVRQTSSYDTTGNNDDGFSGKYSFVRRNPDSSLVIFEAKGNGVINRIWTPTPNDDLLDFYFGGAKKPSFSIRFSDLFSNKVFPFVLPLCGNQLGGYYCYLPIPFRDGCKIVSRGKKMEFYQIQYRAYPKATAVRNFSLQLKPEETMVLKSLEHNWKKIQEKGTQQGPSKSLQKDLELQPGQSQVLAELNTPGRITRLAISPASAFSGLEKQIDLRITWDDESTPAVYAPLADFFGYAFGLPSMQSLLLGAQGDTLYLNFPMPFDRKAKVELLYRSTAAKSIAATATSVSKTAVDVSSITAAQKHRSDSATNTSLNSTTAQTKKLQLKIEYTDQQRDPAREGKFYAFWNKDLNAPLGKPHIFLEGQGRGHYVGTILQAQGLEPGMTLFFEGDDETYVDGQMTAHGTGSEDYFNGGWYAMLDRWDTKMSLPLHGALDYSLPFSRTGGYRLFVSDKMPFEESLRHIIEHGPENNNKRVDYTSIALYYAEKAIHKNQQQPQHALTTVYIPDTLMLYPQLMNYGIMGNFSIDGNTYTANNSGNIRINLSEIPAGRYKLYADLESNIQGATVSLWQRQSLLRDSLSFYATDKQIRDKTFLVPITLDAFKSSITFQFKPGQEGKKIWINRLIFIRE